MLVFPNNHNSIITTFKFKALEKSKTTNYLLSRLMICLQMKMMLTLILSFPLTLNFCVNTLWFSIVDSIRINSNQLKFKRNIYGYKIPERILQKTRVASIPTFCESYHYVFRSEVINFCLVLAWFDENNENLQSLFL